MNKKNWISVNIQAIRFENEDVITSSVESMPEVTPGENETPILPI